MHVVTSWRTTRRDIARDFGSNDFHQIRCQASTCDQKAKPTVMSSSGLNLWSMVQEV
jgi:hypothetical protein